MNALGLAAYGSSDDEEDAPHESEAKTAPLVVAHSDHDEEEDELEAALLRAGIPSEPLGPPDADVQARIRKYLAQSDARSGGFQQSLRAKRDVGNPYILEKVVAHFRIDELHSNFAPHVFDPHALPLHEYSDALALTQKRQAEAREQRQRQQSQTRQLQFTHGGN